VQFNKWTLACEFDLQTNNPMSGFLTIGTTWFQISWTSIALPVAEPMFERGGTWKSGFRPTGSLSRAPYARVWRGIRGPPLPQKKMNFGLTEIQFTFFHFPFSYSNLVSVFFRFPFVRYLFSVSLLSGMLSLPDRSCVVKFRDTEQPLKFSRRLIDWLSTHATAHQHS